MTHSTNFKNTEKMKTLSRLKNAASIKTAQQKGFYNIKSLSLNKVTHIALKLKPLVVILIFLLPLLTISQNIKWAKSYNGQGVADIEFNTNTIINSVYDSKGNLYIAARAGGSAVMDNSDIFGIPSNKFGVFIAKIDSEGTVIWNKSIVSQYDKHVTAQLQLIDDSVLSVFTLVYPPYMGGNDKMYFLDTIIKGDYKECTFPFPKNKWGYDALLELDTEDGHLITANYLHMLWHGSSDLQMPLQSIYFTYVPFFIDRDRNLYLFISMNTGGPGTSGLDIVVNDEDTLSFAEDTRFTSKIVKLSNDLKLVWAKDIVKNIETNGYDYDSLFWARLRSLHFTGDTADNMYLTGVIESSQSMVNDVDFFGRLDIGNNKNLYLNRMTDRAGFIIKYDTSGTAQWNGQFYIDDYNEDNLPYLASAFFKPTIEEDYLYVPYRIRGVNKNQHVLYLDSLLSKPMNYDNMQGRGWEHSGFIKYDKNTGEVLSHGLVKGYSENHTTLAVSNGLVLGQVYHNNSWDIGGLDTIIQGKQSAVSLVRWNDNGELIDIIANYNCTRGDNVTKNVSNPTEIFISGRFESDTLNLQDTLLVSRKIGDNNAYMFVLQDSSLLNHYTVIYDTVCDSTDWRGQHITWKGDYYDTLAAADGYDSIVIYRVRIRPSFKDEKTVEITEGETYDFHGQILTSAGTYYDSLQTISGCDSVYILNLSVKSGLENIGGYINIESIDLAPNPTKDEVTITCNVKTDGQIVFTLYSTDGKETLSHQINSGKETISLKHLPSGTYYYNVAKNGKIIQTDKLVIIR